MLLLDWPEARPLGPAVREALRGLARAVRGILSRIGESGAEGEEEDVSLVETLTSLATRSGEA